MAPRFLFPFFLPTMRWVLSHQQTLPLSITPPLQRPEPGDVGYFFSYLTHSVVEGGSSKGTAFPSGHCAITTAATICAAIYMWPLAVLYAFISPALVC